METISRKNIKWIIHINAKNTAFFEKNGFVLADRNAVPKSAYSYCADCEDYGIKCFPKIMINEFKNGKGK